ncbi:DUF4870 domain-containing protein [Enterococcus mediterraneensis]|uniref:DUF4870 domain-containing protein n=1 Tax=Enterococcus mediterraneensis TaxID=2364791 RepID=UPI000F06108D|nr:DUF4870 domain-containing protein [Enterococcus mediterraneensis]
MTENKILSALSYISIIFAPFIFPLIVWFLTPSGSETKYHAGRALKLHLLPVVLMVILFIMIGGIGLFWGDHPLAMQSLGLGTLLIIILISVVSVALGIYNLYYGIKLLVAE